VKVVIADKGASDDQNDVTTAFQGRLDFNEIRKHYGNHSKKTIVEVDDPYAVYRSVPPLQVDEANEKHQGEVNQVC
jgi:hypothetical protein